MQLNILWAGIEYKSLENCLLNLSKTGSEVSSTIIGCYQQKIYQVDYRLQTDRNWKTISFEITSRHSDQSQSLRFLSDGQGNWTLNDKKADEFNGCLDVDISLTPFTNTLAIRRLELKKNQGHEIRVIYCDILNRHITPVRQQYTCISDTEYHYENVPNDFEATIRVDHDGLVIDYPSLFVRTAVLPAHYT